MTLAERLILYVVQKITDEEAVPSRTKLLKIIYLIDVEFYRHHRKTLTGWKWVFYHYGPYVFDFPRILERLEFASLNEAEDSTTEGRKFFKYRVIDNQSIDDLVSLADRSRIDKIIERWALEDLNLLLNYVYFGTDPMRDAKRGQPLDFKKIPRSVFHPFIDPAELTPSKEQVAQLRKKLAELRKKSEEDDTETRKILTRQPFVADEHYLDAFEKLNRSAESRLPLGSTVASSAQAHSSE